MEQEQKIVLRDTMKAFGCTSPNDKQNDAASHAIASNPRGKTQKKVENAVQERTFAPLDTVLTHFYLQSLA